MKRGNLLAALITACLLTSVSGGDLRADDIAWDEVVGDDPTTLTGAQKERAVDLLRSISNTSGCQGNLAHCLNRSDITARRHAGFVLRMIRREKTDTYIREGILKRHRSVHSPEIAVIDLRDSPRKGTKNAPVVLVEYACFECPACARLAPELDALVKRFGDQVDFYYKFYPLRSHEHGVAAAAAGYAAYQQGRFWELHDLLFANFRELADDDLQRLAAQQQLIMPNYMAAISSHQTLKKIERSKLEGMRNGVEGTPTLFVNGRKFEGPYLIEEIIDRVEIEIERTK